MQWQRLVQRYNQTQVETSNPLHLVLLAYDGALMSLKKAVEKDQQGDYEQKGREIQRALDIVNELWSALDMEQGKEIALSLSAIYRFVTSQILEANARKDIKTLELMYDLLKELREAWSQLSVDRPQVTSRPPSETEHQRAPASAL
jgi:flagellar protein FliS